MRFERYQQIIKIVNFTSPIFYGVVVSDAEEDGVWCRFWMTDETLGEKELVRDRDLLLPHRSHTHGEVLEAMEGK